MNPEFKKDCVRYLIDIWYEEEEYKFRMFCMYVRARHSEMPKPEIEALMKECMETEEFKNSRVVIPDKYFANYESFLCGGCSRIIYRQSTRKQNYCRKKSCIFRK